MDPAVPYYWIPRQLVALLFILFQIILYAMSFHDKTK